MGINHCTLSGNLTRNSELRSSASGVSALSFGIAFNERRRRKDSDEWEEVANFIDCALFGARADALADYLVKGTKVSLDGKLRWNQWEDEFGEKHSKIELIVNDLEFMSPRASEG